MVNGWMPSSTTSTFVSFLPPSLSSKAPGLFSMPVITSVTATPSNVSPAAGTFARLYSFAARPPFPSS